jgi:hypothetical protein
MHSALFTSTELVSVFDAGTPVFDTAPVLRKKSGDAAMAPPLFH